MTNVARVSAVIRRRVMAPSLQALAGPTLVDVVEHYNRVRSLNLTDAQKRDLVEYLKTL